MTNRVRRILATIAALLVVGWCIVASDSFQACLQNARNQRAEDHTKKQSKLFNILAFPDQMRACTGAFIRENDDSIVAIFTFVLALATIYLWSATKGAVASAGENARRELRAYVAVVPTRIIRVPNDTVAIEVVARNFGRTPARATQINGGREILSFAGSKNIAERAFRYSRTAESMGRDLYPGDKREMPLPAFTVQEMDSMRERVNEARIHVAGIVTYEDIYGKICETTFYCLIHLIDFLQLIDRPERGNHIHFEYGPARYNRGS